VPLQGLGGGVTRKLLPLPASEHSAGVAVERASQPHPQ
jgi:hypothetical protein